VDMEPLLKEMYYFNIMVLIQIKLNVFLRLMKINLVVLLLEQIYQLYLRLI
jgi:hypothetical protein